jgi:TRAP-type transport system periplasmic protein
MHGLGFGSIYERNVASKAPARVETPEDMQGLKIRVLPTPGFVEAYNALGTQPTPMAYGELFMAIQNNVVDALEISPDALVADKFHEVVNSYTMTKAHQSTTILRAVGNLGGTACRRDAGDDPDRRDESIAVGIAAHDELAAAGLETAARRGRDHRARPAPSWRRPGPAGT